MCAQLRPERHGSSRCQSQHKTAFRQTYHAPFAQGLHGQSGRRNTKAGLLHDLGRIILLTSGTTGTPKGAPRAEPRSFILPGGSEAAARVHVARAGVRRAERCMTALAAAEPVNPAALAYVNRLSDFLFVLARAVNAAAQGDVLWVPGQNR